MAQISNVNGTMVLSDAEFTLEEIEINSTWVPQDGTIRRIVVTKVDTQNRSISYRDSVTQKRFTRDFNEFLGLFYVVVNSASDFKSHQTSA